MIFAPIRTLEDLDSLDEAQIIEGYTTTKAGDPEPGENRGRAFWHGWRNRMIDLGEIKGDDAAAELVAAWCARERMRRAQGGWQ